MRVIHPIVRARDMLKVSRFVGGLRQRPANDGNSQLQEVRSDCIKTFAVDTLRSHVRPEAFSRHHIIIPPTSSILMAPLKQHHLHAERGVAWRRAPRLIRADM